MYLPFVFLFSCVYKKHTHTFTGWRKDIKNERCLDTTKQEAICSKTGRFLKAMKRYTDSHVVEKARREAKPGYVHERCGSWEDRVSFYGPIDSLMTFKICGP